MKFQVNLHDSKTGDTLSAVLAVDSSTLLTDKAQEAKYYMESAVRNLFESLDLEIYHYGGRVTDMNGKQIGVQSDSFIDSVYGDEMALPGDCPDFRMWLEQRNPKSIVGVSSEGDRCPIQQWILKTTGKNVFVSAEYVEGMGKFGLPTRSSLPEWASSFIKNLDTSLNGSVRASDALAVIENNHLC